jgi:ComEC/Rec2-related protein
VLATATLAAWLAGLAIGYAGPTMDPVSGPGWPGAWQWLAVSVACAAAGMMLVPVGAWRAARGLIPVGVLTLGLAWGAAAVHRPGAATVDGYIGARVSIEGTVASVTAPLSGAGGSTASQQQGFRLAVSRLSTGRSRHAVSGLILVQAHSQAEVWPGQLVEVAGRLARVRQLGPGGMAGYGDRLARQGVEGELAATGVVALSPPPRFSLARMVDALRRSLAQSIRDVLPEPEATIVLGEVAGIRGKLPPAVDSDLVDSGLVHLLAISGIKVAIIAGLLQAMAVAIAGRRAALTAIAGVGLYTLVGGASASALRSAFMGSLGLAGKVLRRDTDVLRSLMLAGGLMVAWRPSLVLDLSFQYSYLGVAGIHLFAEPMARRMSRLPGALRHALAVTAAAQLATLPLTAHYFQVVPMLGPIANALVLPTLPVSIIAGLLLGVLGAAFRAMAGLMPQVSALLLVTDVPAAALLLWLARLAIVVGHLAAHAPGGVLRVANFGAPLSGAYYGAIVGFAVAHRGVRWRLPAAVGAAALAGTLVLALMSRPDGRLHLSFLAAGGGPAVLVTAPDGMTMLIDSGSQAGALGTELDATLPPALPLPGWRRLDSLVLTGGSRPEAGGLSALGRFSFRSVAAPQGLSSAAVGWLSSAASKGSTMAWLRPGDSWTWHGLQLSVAESGQEGLALTLDYGSARIAILETGAKGSAAVPAGAYTAVDVGDGASEPALEGVDTRLVVAQDAAGHPVARALRLSFADSMSQATRDGRLDVTCDAVRCTW